MTEDFTGLPVGTRLDDQLPGITFLKYGGIIGGIVVDTPERGMRKLQRRAGPRVLRQWGEDRIFRVTAQRKPACRLQIA